MNLAYLGATVSATILLGIGYNLAERAGFITSDERVKQIILMEESVERMEFQLRYVLSELRRYEVIPEGERTESDWVQITELKDQAEQLRTRIKQARGY